MKLTRSDRACPTLPCLSHTQRPRTQGQGLCEPQERGHAKRDLAGGHGARLTRRLDRTQGLLLEILTAGARRSPLGDELSKLRLTFMLSREICTYIDCELNANSSNLQEIEGLLLHYSVNTLEEALSEHVHAILPQRDGHHIHEIFDMAMKNERWHISVTQKTTPGWWA